MVDYNAYKAEKGIETKDVVAALKPKFPNFSRIQMCNICAPQKYGVCLLPEAEYLLVDHFGFGAGLSITDDGTYTPQPVPPAKKKKQNRSKPCSCTFRFTPELNEAVRAQMARLNIATMQEYMEEAVSFFLQCGLGEG